MKDNRFMRWQALIGEKAFQCLTAKRVLIFGVGGVGSFLAEALARGGIGGLTLVDDDTVAVHNINRQIQATSTTVGQDKAAAMASRVRDINPDCDITAIVKRLLPTAIGDFQLEAFDCVADAIDDVPAKVAIIRYCQEMGVPVVSAMGAGNKLDPAALEVADISETSVCPLSRSVRQKLRRQGIESGVPVVYSGSGPGTLPFCKTDGPRRPALPLCRRRRAF